MIIIGVDYHSSDQYIAFADNETGECGERRLNHSDGDRRAVVVNAGVKEHYKQIPSAK
jgi:hypothetical protein